jgi:putative hydrolase of the HAD superfamily
MKKEEIKALILDIGGVLQISKQQERIIKDKNLKKSQNCNHMHKGVHEYISEKLKISLDQYFDSIDTFYAKSITGEISKKEVLNKIAKNLKISTKKLKKLFISAYKKNFKFNKQLFKQILRFKKKGYKIAILSDQWHLSKEALVTKKLIKNFNPILISCDSGMRKPNPKFYRLILKKMNLPAKNTIFIDNQEWNIKPAKKIGMNTILFKNNKQAFKQLFKILK